MVIARINDYEILDIEYKAELQRVMHNMHLNEPSREAKERAISQLIDGYLLLVTARKADIEITSDEIENRYLDYTIEYENEDDFKNALHEMNLNENTLRNKIRDELTIKKYLHDNFQPCDKIPMERLEKIYKENKGAFIKEDMVRASHILIKGTSEESFNKANEIRESIHSTEDFIKVARDYSDCPSSCKCGDLGFFAKGKMVKAFDDVAFSLDINEISKPVKTQFGYHLIMITEKKKSQLAKFDEVKEALSHRLKRIDSELKIIRELKRLRSEVDITINEDLL